MYPGSLSCVFTPPLVLYRRLGRADDWVCSSDRYALDYCFLCVDSALFGCLLFHPVTATHHSQSPDTIPHHVLSPDVHSTRCPASICPCSVIVQFRFASFLLRVASAMLSETAGALIEWSILQGGYRGSYPNNFPGTLHSHFDWLRLVFSAQARGSAWVVANLPLLVACPPFSRVICSSDRLIGTTSS